MNEKTKHEQYCVLFAENNLVFSKEYRKYNTDVLR